MKLKKELSFLDSEKNQKKVRLFFYVTIVFLLITDFFISKHGHFSWESAPAFYAVYGFVACVSLIFIAKVFRLLVRRKENYYD
jgi:hypothetical protein